MKHLFILSLVLPSLLISCKDKTNSRINHESNSTEVSSVANTSKFNLENIDILKRVKYDDLSISYSPVNLVSELSDGNLIFKTRDTAKLVAQLSVSDLSNIEVLDISGTNPVFRKKGSNKELILEVFDVIEAESILRHSFYDSTPNSKSLENGTIILKRRDDSENLKNYVAHISDAPIQYLAARRVGNLDQNGTYEFWFDNELKMVREVSSDNISRKEFEIIESINIDNALSENFKIDFNIEELDKDYNKISFKVINETDKGAFVTSNPITGLSHKCVEMNYKTGMISKRIENGVLYTMAFKKGLHPECLTSKHEDKSIYIFDKDLNYIKVKY
ncbi:hypothetical protein [Halobacteriovorax sp. DA5]|uniref:hypothetical protein n=1 Tax=Halobacteriovorax sp. DA5 TaxID=2067553 RepID=UPI000CD10E4A|nr:hypothetical protein [Halobacteriovorax sp. DA5]POB13566.1 hypothetical protein C0Z22_10405 [Halobacteriovorax sp. DA5]